MPELDSPLLLSTLRSELRAAWATLHAAYAQDQLYGFGVYTTDSASYLNVTAFSEAGLAHAVALQPGKREKAEAFFRGRGMTDAADIYANERIKGTDPVLEAQSLRWSPCDSPLHEEGSELLPESSRIARDFVDAWHEQDEEDPGDDESEELDAKFGVAIEELFEQVVLALREMDEEGLFGTGAHRDKLVLCVWKGDQSNGERYQFAKALNPPAVARRFGNEMNEGLRAFFARTNSDTQPPEDDVFD